MLLSGCIADRSRLRSGPVSCKDGDAFFSTNNFVSQNFTSILIFSMEPRLDSFIS